MKIKFNRFAIVPRMCSSCKRYILFEAYRRSDVYHFMQGRYCKENICNECIKKYDVKDGKVVSDGISRVLETERKNV